MLCIHTAHQHGLLLTSLTALAICISVALDVLCEDGPRNTEHATADRSGVRLGLGTDAT